MEIRTYGGGRRLSRCEQLLRGKKLSSEFNRLILLPIPTARDNKYITGTATTVGEIAAMLTPHTAVAGYNIPTEITEAASRVGATVYDGGLDECFLSENAELTARGALGYILTHVDSDISDMHIGVVGYGRIGRRMVDHLSRFGGRITVYTGRGGVADMLRDRGIGACVISDENDLSGLDILINTAPSRQFSDRDIPPELDIIDLASGMVFEPSAKLIKLASIPDAFYPLTAGRLYAEAIYRRIGGGVR